jgi:hypothetical protein
MIVLADLLEHYLFEKFSRPFHRIKGETGRTTNSLLDSIPTWSPDESSGLTFT